MGPGGRGDISDAPGRLSRCATTNSGPPANIYTLAGREVDFTEPTYALLDPRTLREKASYPETLVMGAHHALTMDDQEHDVMLRDLRTGSAMPLTKPASGSARPATTRRSSIYGYST